MQTAGMLRGTRATYVIALLITLIGYTHSYPLQILPSIPGHIPVYIRHGDEPLDHVHPGLAEAFHEPPSSKNFRLEDFPSPEQISFEEASRYLSRFNNKIIFPAYPRDPEASTIGSLDELKYNGPKESDVSKVTAIDKIHEDEEETENHHGPSKRTPPSLLEEAAYNLSPISDVERENLEKLAVQVAKKEIGTRNRDVNSNRADESSKGLSRQDVLEGYAEAFKIPKLMNDEDPKEADTNEEEPVKREKPETVLSNVQKLSPISPEEKKDSASKEEEPMNLHIIPMITSEIIPESTETNDSPAESFVKTMHPEHLLSNVDKVITSSVSSDSENMMDKHSDAASTNEPTVSIPMEDSDPSKKDDTPKTTDELVKVQQSENIMENVLKISPMSNANREMGLSDGSVSASVAEEKEGKKGWHEDSEVNHETDVNSGRRRMPSKFMPRIGIPVNVRKLLPKETMEKEHPDEIAME